MDMTGERRIPAPRQKVWEALNDPAVLKACIPGCESLEQTAPDEMRATAAVRIGPIGAKFSGRVQLSDIDPPNGYKITGDGQGGAAGFAKGGATVSLKDDAEATLLSYVVQAQVGGKLAQIGARLIDASAKQLADQFFDRFTQQVALMVPPEPVAAVEGATAGEGIPVVAPPPPLPPPAPAALGLMSLLPREPFGFPLVAWIGGFVFLLIFILIFSSIL